MDILNRLSRPQTNPDFTPHAIAQHCLAEPALLVQLPEGLASSDFTLAGRCAEVYRWVAEKKPELLREQAPALIPVILHHRHSLPRREASQALALLADTVPELIQTSLPGFAELIERDDDQQVRHNTVDAVARYAGTSPAAADLACPILLAALEHWGEAHARYALQGLQRVVRRQPERKAELGKVAERYLEAKSGLVRMEAKKLVR
jgi:hypothetical protein